MKKVLGYIRVSTELQKIKDKLYSRDIILKFDKKFAHVK